jgi:lipopolysaccharide assembly protein A
MRWAVAVPLFLLLILFALSNREPVSLELFPLGRLPFDVPLSIAILAAMGVGFLLGGLRLWNHALRHRRAARKAEDAMRLLELKHQELKSRMSGPALVTPGRPDPAPGSADNRTRVKTLTPG